MPVELQWHTELPVLMATYTGTLTAKIYQAMCHQRRAMLSEKPAQVVIIANMQGLEGLRDADSFERDNTVLLNQQVLSTFVVLPTDLYRRVMQATIASQDQHYPIKFFGDIDSALNAASQLIRNHN